MSIGRIALRLTAVEALKNQTSVDNNVLDSQNGALESVADGSLTTDQEKPFIAVYTETGKNKAPDFRSLRSNVQIDMLFEFGVTFAMSTENDRGESEIVPGLVATDAGMEFFLDCVARDISKALTDEANEWAEIWRGLVLSLSEVERKRIGNEANGVPLAAHQLRIRVDAVADPVFGQSLAAGSIWQKLLNVMEKYNHPYFEQMKSLLQNSQGSGDGCVRRRFGLTLDETIAMFPKKKD